MTSLNPDRPECAAPRGRVHTSCARDTLRKPISRSFADASATSTAPRVDEKLPARAFRPRDASAEAAAAAPERPDGRVALCTYRSRDSCLVRSAAASYRPFASANIARNRASKISSDNALDTDASTNPVESVASVTAEEV